MPLSSCYIQWMPLQVFIIEHYVVLREARHRQLCSNAEWNSAGWKGGVQLKEQWTKKQLVLAALLKEVQCAQVAGFTTVCFQGTVGCIRH